MNFETPKNVNYCAVVVELRALKPLDNCDNVQAAFVFGNQIIVGKDAKLGDVGLFFPAETQLTRDFLANNNLFRKPEWGNMDQTKKGFFEEHGRVKTMKFRGHKSEGLWIPLSSLEYLGHSLSEFAVGAQFDAVGDRVICRKYVPRRNQGSVNGVGTFVGSLKTREDKLVSRQFRFHDDTHNLRRNAGAVKPNDIISITDKWHGTSTVIGKLLIKRQLSWLERAAKWLGVKVQEAHYGMVWSSRRVIKGVNEELSGKNHFYDTDIYGVVAKELELVIPDGYTLYGEIVGYTPTGVAIQSIGGRDYAYGCEPGKHRFLVYRITVTNVVGEVVELTLPQVKAFCYRNGLETVKDLYYGTALAFVPTCFAVEDPKVTESLFAAEFLSAVEMSYVRDQDCPYNPGLPAEGVVVKIERFNENEAYKVKNFRFLEGETKDLDKGVVDMETAEAEPEEAIA